MEEYRLELRNVSNPLVKFKRLKNINFRLGRNEIVGLLGEWRRKIHVNQDPYRLPSATSGDIFI